MLNTLYRMLGLPTNVDELIEQAGKSKKPVTIRFSVDDGFLKPGPYSIILKAGTGLLSTVTVDSYQHVRKGVIDPEGVQNLQRQALERAVQFGEDLERKGIPVDICGDTVRQARENLGRYNN